MRPSKLPGLPSRTIFANANCKTPALTKALAGIDQAKAQIAAAQAGKEAVQAELVRARSERKRQEGLYQTHSTTQQKVEVAVADEERLAAQYASRDADLDQARDDAAQQ